MVSLRRAAPSTSSAAAAGLPARPARRVQPPSWRDVRLLVGVCLVLASTVLGAVLVGKARATTPVLVVQRAVPAGQTIAAADLVVADVRLGDLGSHYLAASARPPEGSVAARDLRTGDILPADAVVRRGDIDRRRLVVPVQRAVAAALVRGSTVEVWVSDRGSAAGTETFAPPRKALAGAVVADPKVGRDDLGGGDRSSVAVWVPDAAVAGLLAAVDHRSAITLVPQPGSPVEDAS